MRKSNTTTTRPAQDRAVAAIKRRAKRTAARDALIAPYQKLLDKANEERLRLLKQIADMRRAAATQPGPTELASNQAGATGLSVEVSKTPSNEVSDAPTV